MRTASIISCSHKSTVPSLAGEIYSLNSRCFVTDTSSSVCLESYCNSVDFKIDIVVDSKVTQCDYEGQELDLGLGYTVSCPRLAVVCPHFICPANCSGKGICDYCLEVPQCVCDDPFNESPDCSSGIIGAGIHEKDADKNGETALEHEKEKQEDHEAVSFLGKKEGAIQKLSQHEDDTTEL